MGDLRVIVLVAPASGRERATDCYGRTTRVRPHLRLPPIQKRPFLSPSRLVIRYQCGTSAQLRPSCATKRATDVGRQPPRAPVRRATPCLGLFFLAPPYRLRQ